MPTGRRHWHRGHFRRSAADWEPACATRKKKKTTGSGTLKGAALTCLEAAALSLVAQPRRRSPPHSCSRTRTRPSLATGRTAQAGEISPGPGRRRPGYPRFRPGVNHADQALALASGYRQSPHADTPRDSIALQTLRLQPSAEDARRPVSKEMRSCGPTATSGKSSTHPDFMDASRHRALPPRTRRPNLATNSSVAATARP